MKHFCTTSAPLGHLLLKEKALAQYKKGRPEACPFSWLYESIDGFAVVLFSGLHNGLGPFGVVEAVGVELGLQGDAGALAVVDAVFALLVQVIACVELNARAVWVDFHGSAGNRVGQDGAGVAVYFPVVIVATLQVQRLVVHADVPADGLCSAEVHGVAVLQPLSD